jgi:hypothetical protein
MRSPLPQVKASSAVAREEIMEISYCFRWSGTGNIAAISYVSAVPDPEIIEEII